MSDDTQQQAPIPTRASPQDLLDHVVPSFLADRHCLGRVLASGATGKKLSWHYRPHYSF